MLYSIIKIISRFAIRIFCRKIIINKPDCLKEKGPLLIASNHPNSFLDSIIIDTLFKEPVWSLARGDVFKKPFYLKLLRRLKILPLYRHSEGVQNLPNNYKTFDDCIDIFKKNGVVMIFSEAKSVNEWHLRPLRKGTARLAFKAWEDGVPLKVLALGINYSSFKKFGKNVFINFGEPFSQEDIPMEQADGLNHQAFNEILEKQLLELVFEIDKNDIAKQKAILEIKPTAIEKVVLGIPALLGWIVHLPLYLPLKQFTRNKTPETDHYDSVLTALLFVLYPFYLLLIVIIVFFITGSAWAFLILVLLPALAWSYIRIKEQIDE